MNEKNFDSEQHQGEDPLLRARATLDAHEYIQLMKEKNPENLALDNSGNIVFDLKNAEDICENAFRFLKIEGVEFGYQKTEYLLALSEEIKKLLRP